MSATVYPDRLILNRIAVDVYNSNRGSFLKAIADAWCRADPSNKAILLPAWWALIIKYNLDTDSMETGEGALV